MNTKPKDELTVPPLPVLSSRICADKPINDTGITVFEVKEPISVYVSVFLLSLYFIFLSVLALCADLFFRILAQMVKSQRSPAGLPRFIIDMTRCRSVIFGKMY